MIRRPKTYQVPLNTLRDQRALNILRDVSRPTTYIAFTIGNSKQDAYERFMAAGIGWPVPRDVKTGGGLTHDALRHAGLLERPTILIISDRHAITYDAVVRLEDGERGAQLIGSITYSGNTSRFTTTLAEVCTDGSVLLGPDATLHAWGDYDELSFGNTRHLAPGQPDKSYRWKDSYGAFHDDKHVQELLDSGRYRLIRVGLGDWFDNDTPDAKLKR